MSFNNKVAPTKPLKGGSIVSNFGTFDTLSTTTLIVEDIDFSALADGGTFTNSDILDATINRSTIGLNIPSIGYFTELRAFDDVTFISNIIGATASWEVDTGTFTISSAGSLQVLGCSKLGNLEICNNSIKAINTNGDVVLIPNGLGGIFFNGPVYNSSTTGSFFVQMTNGGATFDVSQDISLGSSRGNIIITSNKDQTLSTINGDVIVNVDQGITETLISSVGTTLGNLFVMTTFPNNLKTNDVINITGNSTINGDFTIQSVINDNRFLLTTTSASVITGSGGSYLKYPNNSIVLNSQTFVKVPADTKVTLGDTCNSISGNTSALAITSCGDILLDAPFDKSVIVPELTKLQFGSSGTNYITASSGTIDVNTSNLRISGDTTQINSTNTSFYDPILTIGDYTYNSFEEKDRGIEFRYFEDNQMKLGWFGFKTSSGSFSFLTDATNTNELISGSKGNLDVGVINASSVESSGDITLDCANIVGVNVLRGCSGNITIQGTSNVVVEAINGRIDLVAGVEINVPQSVPLKFGTSGNYVMERADGDFIISSNKNVEFSTQSSGALVIPKSTYISFDGSSIGNQRIVGDSVGNLKLEGQSDILLNTTGGNIKVPASTEIHFGSSDASISGDASGLNLMSTLSIDISASSGNIQLATLEGDINLLTSNGNVRIPQTKALVFSLSNTTNSASLNSVGNFVLFGNSSNSLQVSNFDDIYLSASSNIYVPTTTKLQFGSNNRYITSSELEELFIVNSATLGSINVATSALNVSSNSTIITGTQVLFNVTDVKIKDPILTIGETFDDNKDRGLEYYVDVDKLGWFGYKASTGRFTVYETAVNNEEVISGTLGDLHVANAYIDSELQFLGTGQLDLNCGNIINASSISGCGGILDINGQDIINIRATSVTVSGATFEFDVSSHVKVPNNVPIIFGNTESNIVCDTSGNFDINANNLSVYANERLDVYGQTTNIYSTTVNIRDPIVSIGGVIDLTQDDNKDRGIEFKWHDGVDSKTGFFGMKDESNRFVYIVDGINNDEVFSGISGDVQFGNGYFDNLQLNNGEIAGVRVLSGGEIQIASTSGNIYIAPAATQNVVLPFDVDIVFGSTANSIGADTFGNLAVTANNDLTFVSNSFIVEAESHVTFPGGIPINIGDAQLSSKTDGNFVVTNSTGNIQLVPESGNVEIPIDTFLEFGSTSNSIYSDGAELFINGFNSVYISSGSLVIGGNVVVEGSFDTDTYILPLGTFQKLDITSITSSSSGVLVTTTDVHYLTIGDQVEISATNSVPTINGTFTVTNVNSDTEFFINDFTVFTTDGTFGKIKSNLKTGQNKDVGIQVNYWRNTTSDGVTSGSVNYNTGFFGYKIDTNRWTFYDRATISNFVVSGTLGDIEVNKIFTDKVSGFVLEGDVSAGNRAIIGSNFQIDGGNINTTPIGQSSAAPGRFTTLTSTVSAAFNNVALNQSLTYSIERYQLNSGGVQFRNPTTTSIVSLFSVIGVNYNGSSGTMPSTAVSDGTLKYLVCASIGEGCSHTIFFGSGKIIAPTQPSSPNPTKIVFKRAGQSAQLMFSSLDSSWILLNAGAYVA